MDRLHECFDGSYRRLVSQLYGVCGCLTEAEDVVSEAFVRAASDPRRFEALDNPEAWLRTVAVNLARTRRRRQVLAERFARRAAPLARDAVLDGDTVDLMRALRALPATQREALALYYLADLSVDEVAATVGAPTGTVKARLARGRAALATSLAMTPNSRSLEEQNHA